MHEKLIHILKFGSAEDVTHQRCPKCGKSLRVAFTPGTKSALGATCPSCLWGLRSDGLKSEPPWVSQIGKKFETDV